MKDTGRSSGHGASLPKFMQQALRHPLISREEERDLARSARKIPKKPLAGEEAQERARTRHGAAYRAREELVEGNLRFILQQALRHSRFGRTEPDDAFQEGALGHIEAIGRFKTSAGTRLSTYASWWIRHAVMRYGQDHGRDVRVPVNALQKAYALSRAEQRFERLNGRLPDLDELSTATGIPRKRIEAIRIAVQEAASLDEVHRDAEGQGRTLQEIIPSPADDPEEAFARGHDAAALGRAMAVLTPFESAVIRCRFFEEMTLVETAAALAGQTRRGEELSRERIRQIEAVALGKLRDALA